MEANTELEKLYQNEKNKDTLDTIKKLIASKGKEASAENILLVYKNLSKYIQDFLKQNNNDTTKFTMANVIDKAIDELPLKIDLQNVPTEEEKFNGIKAPREVHNNFGKKNLKALLNFGDNLEENIIDMLSGIGLIKDVDYRIVKDLTASNTIMCPYYQTIKQNFDENLFGKFENGNKASKAYSETLLKNNLICIFFLEKNNINKFRVAMRASKLFPPDFTFNAEDIPQIKDLPYIVYNIMTTQGNKWQLATICTTLYFGRTRTILNLNRLKKLADTILNTDAAKKFVNK